VSGSRHSPCPVFTVAGTRWQLQFGVGVGHFALRPGGRRVAADSPRSIPVKKLDTWATPTSENEVHSLSTGLVCISSAFAFELLFIVSDLYPSTLETKAH
jgi:hypothetical protein